MQGKDEKFLLLPYNFPWKIYELEPPWYSAMAQGKALPLLIYAYQLTGSEKYKETANGILNSFFIDVTQGGITYKTSNSGWWYELYAKNDSKKPKVLNGMLWTLVALDEYYRSTNDSKAKFLFDQGITSLKKNLHLFDADGFSYYDILKTQNKFEYHVIHIDLLNKLYNVTGEDLFKSYADKWSSHNLTQVVRQAPANIHLDSNFVPFVDYGIISGINIGIQRNPVTVDHIANDYYGKFLLHKDNFSKRAFLNNVDWLVDNAIEIRVNNSVIPSNMYQNLDQKS
ncbi:D-glucuronyl C5-epimerase family protein [Candidatus Nitrosocosmicus hydrocola]|uniref:D-glucuronyl C5-epimerase family protein n=1 Tax=Candidatus Nitrosocosmicus hydrocola TaxID=1826872 RepID=UPI001E5D3BEF|nr:D-glucuronyl C5-epimerase family protein [Candidatus Nitrosocosmicus hydrocola]